MKNEKSCGCIIINNDKVLLIFERRRDYWGFPKGHVENNETEIETALREVKEETGLDVIIDENIRYESNYIVDGTINKQVIYYLASSKNNRVIKQDSEIEKYKWCTFDEAEKLITYNDTKKIFKDAIKRIK